MSAVPGAVLVGLIGRGIQLSRTPRMHEAEGLANRLSYVYRLLDADRMDNPAPSLAEIIRFAEYFGFSGFNVTFPYKQEVLPLLDELSPAATDLGSVNTVVLRNGKRRGHNTDMWGFRENFRLGMPDAARENVLLLGAGGAGVAVAYALLDLGVECLVVHDIEAGRAEALAARLRERFGARRVRRCDDLPAAGGLADGIVNATPVGMAKMPGTPIPVDLLRPCQWVADIVYFPLETELLRAARRLGCATLSGEGMAVYQAARAFEHFTGLVPNVDRMKAAFAAFAETAAA
ncbi:shikimate dehydrogenase [Mesorhizobium sp. L-8-3]|uniref:shikimate dehydrogenase n=1 Tax=Mesorhizobium sp. L-8-3 TaxID=2744522 RepID=UPI00192582BA